MVAQKTMEAMALTMPVSSLRNSTTWASQATQWAEGVWVDEFDHVLRESGSQFDFFQSTRTHAGSYRVRVKYVKYTHIYLLW